MKPLNTLLKSALLSATLVTTGYTLPVAAESYPPAVQQVIDRGVSIKGTFDAPGGLSLIHI